MSEKFDVVSAIMEFEGGELSANSTIKLFSEMLKRKQVSCISGGTHAVQALIGAGYLDENGNILKTVEE